MKNSSTNNNFHHSPFYREINDIDDFKRYCNFNLNHGLCGSVNLGNTCFMNSSIACLSNCTELTAYFLMKKFVNDINRYNYDGAKGKLAEEWYKLLNNYWNTTNKVGNPKSIKNIIGSKNKKFLGYNQQDSNEFMTVFLEILGEDLNRTTKKKYIELQEQQKGETDVEAANRFWSLHVQRNDSIVTDLFHGLLKSTITCPKCHFQNITYDPFNTLALTIPDIRKISQYNQKRKKSVKIQKKKVIENYTIYIVPPLSIRNTKKYEIEVNEKMTLNEIINEIEERGNNIRISKNSKFISVLKREYIKDLKGRNYIDSENYIFGYEIENKDKSDCISFPIYLRTDKKFSAYPRFLFLDNNTSYYDFKKYIYFIVRKYLRHPLYNPNYNEEYELDNELSKYISGKTNRLDKILYLLEEEFEAFYRNNQLSHNFNKHKPYKIYISTSLDDNDDNEYMINQGNYNYKDTLNIFNISSEHNYVDEMIKYIMKKKYYLVVSINTNSQLTKKNISLDSVSTGACLPLKEEEKDEEEEMEIEEEEDNQYMKSNNITLDHCLQYFTEEECLEEGNEWHCSKCRRRVMASKQIELFYLPRILCICLTRFLKKGRFNDYTKNNSFVDFPIENLNMGKYICGPDKKYSKYDLFAVSQHFGGMGGGHYTAVCKNIDGNWYEYDDSSCYRTSSGSVCTSAAYVLFYRRKNW